jgi:hypothetical protein
MLSSGVSAGPHPPSGKKPRKSRSKGLRTTTGWLVHTFIDTQPELCGREARPILCSSYRCSYKAGPATSMVSECAGASRRDETRRAYLADSSHFSIICRKRHIKCDEQTPHCGPCIKANRPCSYDILPIPGQQRSSITPHDQEVTRALEESGHGSVIHPLLSASSELQPLGQEFAPAGAHGPMETAGLNGTGHLDHEAELAPLRWFGLLAGDASTDAFGLSSLQALGEAAEARRIATSPYNGGNHASGEAVAASSGMFDGIPSGSLANPSRPYPLPQQVLDQQYSAERAQWQHSAPVHLQDHEFDIFQRFATSISSWIDMLDPFQHFSTLVPHLAMNNEGKSSTNNSPFTSVQR